jgi:hypothetical protein
MQSVLHVRRLGGPDLVSAAHGLALLGAQPSLDWLSLFWKESEAHMCERRLTHPSYLADLAAAGAALLVAGKKAVESAAQPAWITGGTGATTVVPQPSPEWFTHMASAFDSPGKDRPNWQDDEVSTAARLFLSTAALDQAMAQVTTSSTGAGGSTEAVHKQQDTATKMWALQSLEERIMQAGSAGTGSVTLQDLSNAQLLAVPATLAAMYATGDGRTSSASQGSPHQRAQVVAAAAMTIAGRLHGLPLSNAITALSTLNSLLPPGTSLPPTVRLSLAEVTFPAKEQAVEGAPAVTPAVAAESDTGAAAAAAPSLRKLATQQLWELSLLLSPSNNSSSSPSSAATNTQVQAAVLARTVAGLLASRTDLPSLGPVALVRCLEAVASASAAEGAAASDTAQRELLALARATAETLSAKAGEAPVMLFSRLCSALAVACPSGTSLVSASPI